MMFSSLPDSAKNAVDVGIVAAAGTTILEWVSGHAATGAAIVAGLLGVVRTIDAIVVLYERRTVQKWFGRTKKTRKDD